MSDARRRHDLRTPLNGVLGMLELLLDTRLDERQRQYVLTAQASARTLLAQIDGRPPERPVAAPAWDGPPLSILVAEDGAESLAVVSALLERDGHAVTAVRDGRAAVQAAVAGRFDLALLDLFMPELDGVAAARQILASGGAPRLGVVALTAQAAPDTAEACRAAGMRAVLHKPLDGGALRRLLAELTVAATPVLDPEWLEQARDALGPAKLADLAGRVAAAAAECLGGIERRLGEADAAGVREEAHRLTGLAASYGCAELRLAAQRLEDLAAAGRLGAVVEALDELGATTARALAALRREIDPPRS